MNKYTTIEPNMEIASRWWSDLTDIWTPIGWKDHMFRFNVLFDGRIIAQPDRNKRTEKWKGQGMQLTFQPVIVFKEWGETLLGRFFHDDNRVMQGWNNSSAPVLWSEWSEEGLLLRQEVFAYIPGGHDIVSGIEPLFAWIRLSIHDKCRSLPLEKRCGFCIKINAPHIRTTMVYRNNIVYEVEKSAYPRTLIPDRKNYSLSEGYRIMEEGLVRLGIAPKNDCNVTFETAKPTANDSLLYIQMNTRLGTHVDILLPMIPIEKRVFDITMAKGYDRTLEEANRYWSRIPKEAARVETPEEHINETIKHNLKFAEVIAERNPADGNYSMLTGSLAYTNLWATPHSMACIMFLDTMGYHSVVEKYLELFKREQGTVVAPGDCFKLHPGYLSTPKTLTSIDWLADHGALLYTISEHALLSGNQEFIDAWMETIVKACDFIKYARRITEHEGFLGIMPPAVSTDRRNKIQSVWNNGWIYKGLTAAVKLMKKLEHPRAAEFEIEVAEYKKSFKMAIQEKWKTMTKWTDKNGKKHRLVPTSFYGDKLEETRVAFYLDAGPLFLVYSGLMDANDELMKSALLWFREGPQRDFTKIDSNCYQVPVLVHEMSTCEPCYSWNVFHSHQLGDRIRFLEGMYSLFAGSVSRKTYTFCETRGGITGVTPALLQVYLARLAVIDDQIKDGELHLLRLVPLAWIRTDKETIFENMPTEFGPVTLKISLQRDKRTLKVIFSSKFRVLPKRIILHVPPLKGLKYINLNDKKIGISGKSKIVVTV